MKKINIILAGIGNVGSAFLNLIHQKNAFCLEHYGLDLQVAAVLRSDRMLVCHPTQKPADVLQKIKAESEGKTHDFWKTGHSLEKLIDTFQAGVFVECTPTDSRTGGAGLAYIRLALDRGWNVVTANKGPLVVDYSGLLNRARQNKLALKISGATAAALPTLDVAQIALKGTEIFSFEGILNGTTNYILTQMFEGLSFQDALQEAKNKGIAESDPSLDVEGWDTAYKVLLLTNALFEADRCLKDITVNGIVHVDPEAVDSCRRQGKKLKLIGRMIRRGKDMFLNVGVEAVDRTHPLYSVDGTEKGITFETDTMSAITVIGGKSDPLGTAAAMLKDLINIFT